MRKFIANFFMFIGVVVVLVLIATCVGVANFIEPMEARFSKPGVLLLSLDGVIEDGDRFLEKLRKYRENESVKGVLVQINSPGGVVGPSQEIFLELKRTREEYQKPVVVSCLGLMASGAYYAAVAADKIVVTPGCLAGSIGVIMQFVNLEKLFDWAKVQRYALKTGKFKDTGAEYRPMNDEEKAYLQEMLDDVLGQFKTAVKESRKIDQRVLDENADGRIFTGDMAVKLGFADKVGGLEDARKVIGEMTGLGAKPELLIPRPSPREEFWSLLHDDPTGDTLKQIKEGLFHIKLSGQPLLIWKGYLGL